MIPVPHSEKFFNRELGWLAFNNQVLAEAVDPEVPLMERLRFLGIVANNLDEFFMVRVAELKREVRDEDQEPDPAGMTPAEQLASVSEYAHQHQMLAYKCALEEILPDLQKHGLRIRKWHELSSNQQNHLTLYFHGRVFPILTPLGLDRSHPFPVLRNLCLNLAVLLRKRENEEEDRFAIVQIPRSVSRLVPLSGAANEYLLLEDLVRHHLNSLFPDREIMDNAVFRITRDSELDFDGDSFTEITKISSEVEPHKERAGEDKDSTFIAQVEERLLDRRSSSPVRLEVEADLDPDFFNNLKGRVKLEEQDIYLIPGPLDLNGLVEFANLAGFPQLHYEPFPPQVPPEFLDAKDVWSPIRRKDILLFHPYDSFDPVVELLQTAAEDPDVLAIKQTLYRISRDSPIIEALTQAALNGKQVCVLIELMARFDEERNIEGSRRLADSGAHVIWGIVGLKTHSKICLIVRKEPDGIRRYVHLGTGNYNERTARVYSDCGLMTARDEIGRDASNFFNSVTGFSDVPNFSCFSMAPHTLRQRFVSLIEREISHAELGQPCGITAKMNSLVDQEIIEALYRASRKRVPIRLNVRGICCLRPGVKGLSDTIEVVSIIDRFLEHSRIFHFRNAGRDEVFLSSADWMPRNLDRRIELLFPVIDPDGRNELMDILDIFFKDNRSARVLQPNGRYQRKTPHNGEAALRCQTYFHQQAVQSHQRLLHPHLTQFVPRETRG